MPSRLEARTGHRWLGAYRAFCQQYRKTPRIWLYDEKNRPEREEIVAWLRKGKIDAVLTLAHTIPDLSDRYTLRQVFLNDWHVTPDAWYVSTSGNMIAQEGIKLLDESLLHQRYGVPEHPKQISLKATFHGL